jgi:molybdopterin converting factor small subunit
MDPFTKFSGYNNSPIWQLTNLDPAPEEEWQRLRHFLQIGAQYTEAMLATVEPLFRRGHELVVGTYDYLLDQPETAAILGWEKGADPAHLSERRRFFTVWLARLLGMDFSEDLARYLFTAGKKHAAHGPRRAHVPPIYVTGSISLVNAAFARFLQEEMPGESVVPAALAGWNKVLTLHQHLMLLGYQAAQAVDRGDFAARVRFFGRLRTITGHQELTVRLAEHAAMEDLLRKLFNYYPETREAVLDREWTDSMRLDSTGTPWFEAVPIYRIKPMWRVLVNGKDISYATEPAVALSPGDEVHVFPPGR